MDEFASFAEVLDLKKKVRVSVMSMLYEIVLQGRQLGFFLLITMQKPDAKMIDTALRDNIPLKIILGNSEPQTYITALGHAQIPNRDDGPGDGVFTEPAIAPEPKLVQCPYCGFDILTACRESLGGVTTQAPKTVKCIHGICIRRCNRPLPQGICRQIHWRPVFFPE